MQSQTMIIDSLILGYMIFTEVTGTFKTNNRETDSRVAFCTQSDF